MKNDFELLHQRLAQLEQRCARSERRLRVACGLGLASLAVALFVSPATRAAAQSGYGATIQALIDKTQYITVAGGEMYIRNTNLHLENGTGATNGNPADPFLGPPVVNGKGNLIIGYNGLRSATPFPTPDDRTGSHNLVLGDFQNYTSYGGLVAGRFNAILNGYASVSGGDQNIASGLFASVSGGQGNVASAFCASVSGGFTNFAGGSYASVSGGNFNKAFGTWATVSGGLANTASGVAASVSGGDSNAATGSRASVSGGTGVVQANGNGWAAAGSFPVPPGGPGIFHVP